MAWWVPYAMMAVSAVAQGAAQNKADKRKQSLADQMGVFRSKKAEEGRAAIERFLKGVEPEARQEQTGKIQAELEQGLKESIGETMAFEKPDNFAGKVTDDYRRVRAAGQQRTDERLRRAIEQLKVIGTPRERAFQDAFRYGNAAREVGATTGASERVSREYARAIDQVQQDRFLSIASQLAQGLGMGMALKSSPAPEIAPIPEVGEGGLGMKLQTRPALGLRTGANAGGIGLKGLKLAGPNPDLVL